jgi:hypothetical protein
MPSAHAATSDSGTDWVALAISYWWVLLILGGGILGWIGETLDAGVSALHRRSKLKHKRRLQALKLELQIAQAKGAAPVAEVSAAPQPGPCVHRRVKQVRDRNDELVAWLCVGCDAELPADWAVAKEDL